MMMRRRAGGGVPSGTAETSAVGAEGDSSGRKSEELGDGHGADGGGGSDSATDEGAETSAEDGAQSDDGSSSGDSEGLGGGANAGAGAEVAADDGAQHSGRAVRDGLSLHGCCLRGAVIKHTFPAEWEAAQRDGPRPLHVRCLSPSGSVRELGVTLRTEKRGTTFWPLLSRVKGVLAYIGVARGARGVVARMGPGQDGRTLLQAATAAPGTAAAAAPPPPPRRPAAPTATSQCELRIELTTAALTYSICSVYVPTRIVRSLLGPSPALAPGSTSLFAHVRMLGGPADLSSEVAELRRYGQIKNKQEWRLAGMTQWLKRSGAQVGDALLLSRDAAADPAAPGAVPRLTVRLQRAEAGPAPAHAAADALAPAAATGPSLRETAAAGPPSAPPSAPTLLAQGSVQQPYELPLNAKALSPASIVEIHVPVSMGRGLLVGHTPPEGARHVADVHVLDEDASAAWKPGSLRSYTYENRQYSNFRLTGLARWLKDTGAQSGDALLLRRAPDTAAPPAGAAALPRLTVSLRRQSAGAAQPALVGQGEAPAAAVAGVDGGAAAAAPPGQGCSGGAGQAAGSGEANDPDDVPLLTRMAAAHLKQRASAAASVATGVLTAKRPAGTVLHDVGPPVKRAAVGPGAAALAAATAAGVGARCLAPQQQQQQQHTQTQPQQLEQQRHAPPLPAPAAAVHVPAAPKSASPAPAGPLPASSLTHLHACAPPELGLPTLRPGELRLCGVTFHPDVAPAVQQGIADWLSRLPNGDLAAADSVGAQISVEGLDSGAEWWCQRFRQHQLKRVRIINGVARMLKLSGEGGSSIAPLPEGPVEMPGALRRCAGAAAGGAGAPAGGAPGLEAAEALPKSTALCVVGGYAMPAATAEAFAADGYKHVPPAVRVQLPRVAQPQPGQTLASAWRALAASRCVPYTGAAGAAQATLPSAASAAGVVLCMLGYGGVAALVAEADEATPANCMAVPVCVRGLVLLVLVALRDIAAGERLVCDWGAEDVRQRLLSALRAAAYGEARASAQPAPAPTLGAPSASATGASAPSGGAGPDAGVLASVTLLPSAGAVPVGAGPPDPAAARPSEPAESWGGRAGGSHVRAAGRDAVVGGERTSGRHGSERTSSRDGGRTPPSRRHSRSPRRPRSPRRSRSPDCDGRRTRSRSRDRHARRPGDAGARGSERRRSGDRSCRSPQRRRSRSRSRSRGLSCERGRNGERSGSARQDSRHWHGSGEGEAGLARHFRPRSRSPRQGMGFLASGAASDRPPLRPPGYPGNGDWDEGRPPLRPPPPYMEHPYADRQREPPWREAPPLRFLPPYNARMGPPGFPPHRR